MSWPDVHSSSLLIVRWQMTQLVIPFWCPRDGKRLYITARHPSPDGTITFLSLNDIPNMEGQDIDNYFNLGTYQRQINTTVPAAHTWFNRGLIWSYAFNHEEAARCFEKAIIADPLCLMAHWGVAYSSGPNYDKVRSLLDERTSICADRVST